MPRFASDEPVECVLCRRNVPGRLITLHHLKPKSRGGQADVRVPTCRTCHKQIHACFTNKELDEQYSEVEALRRSDRMRSFLKWAAKQAPDRTFTVRTSDAKPGRKRKRLSARRKSRR